MDTRLRAAVVGSIWPNAQIVSIERCDCRACRTLDENTAIDGFVRRRGVDHWEAYAARFQPDIGFRTFTIRTRIASGGRTEIDKLRGPVRPHWHIHGYEPSDRGPGAILIARTQMLVLAIDQGRYTLKTNGHDGTEFAIVDAHSLGDRAAIVELPFPEGIR